MMLGTGLAGLASCRGNDTWEVVVWICWRELSCQGTWQIWGSMVWGLLESPQRPPGLIQESLAYVAYSIGIKYKSSWRLSHTRVSRKSLGRQEPVTGWAAEFLIAVTKNSLSRTTQRRRAYVGSQFGGVGVSGRRGRTTL